MCRSIPALTDLDFVLTPLSKRLFPGVDFPILVHNGFAATQSRFAAALIRKPFLYSLIVPYRSAPGVLAAVQTALSNHNAHKVTVVGHSLGGCYRLPLLLVY